MNVHTCRPKSDKNRPAPARFVKALAALHGVKSHIVNNQRFRMIINGSKKIRSELFFLVSFCVPFLHLDFGRAGEHRPASPSYFRFWKQRRNRMDQKKLEELIVYLGAHPQVKNLGLTKLWKLIYFVDSEAKRDGGNSVTGSEFIKYDHGPVPSRGQRHLSKLVKAGEVKTSQRTLGDKVLNEVISSRPTNPSAFSRREIEIIDSVCERFGQESAINLSRLSHKEPAWHYADKMQKLSPSLMSYGWEEDPEGL